MRCRVEFTLTMPVVASWNGHWSGEGRDYRIVRSVDAETVARWGTLYWHYSFGDGWAAGVSARVMESGERKKRSDGFCGYEWMVDNIIRWGTAECQHEFRQLENHTYGEGDWEQCRWCRMAQQMATEPAMKATGGES